MWRRLDLAQEDHFARWESLSEELRDPARPHNLYADPVWLAGSDRTQLERLAVYESESGLATFIVGPSALPLCLGELAIGRLRFRRATLADFRAVPGSGQPAELLCALLERAGTDLGGDVVFHLESHGLDFGNEVLALRDSSPGNEWLWLDHGRHVRRFVRLKGSFGEYFGRLSKNTRRTIKRGRSRLEMELGQGVLLQRVAAAHEVGDFVRYAQEVSRKTYQWRLLGSGLRDTEGLVASLRFAASRSRLRAYLLWAGQTPAAFLLGYQCGQTYFPTHTGYDPAFERCSVGMVMFASVLEDLFERDRLDWFDFGSGDAPYKENLANTAVEGVRVYLWPDTGTNRLRVGTYDAVSVLNRLGGYAAERLKIKSRLRKLLRRKARPDDGGA